MAFAHPSCGFGMPDIRDLPWLTDTPLKSWVGATSFDNRILRGGVRAAYGSPCW